MSDAVSALPGARFAGLVDLAEAGPCGMITLRGDLSAAAVAKAVKDTTGLALPKPRQVAIGKAASVAWMAPDECLIVLDYAKAAETVAALETAVADAFATVAEVSDARAVFTIRGAQARDVLAKACPVDFADFPVGTIRRTRAAQGAAAVWRSGEEEFTLVCFRSVAGYMWDLLTTLARPGGEVGLYR
ncbi:sarcosine oxidase subunit gamma family protein [Pararhodobacter sp. SW119]|uniref:sarcosine oxidase subunit gamma n=1 Tax=Pararhodobacter sp. SW119 TaxID=2780075 RepID=UPI001AE089C9|nr:sarcosine oxidase subunit gamma family protein [Pararhodobacter sp. SW119]